MPRSKNIPLFLANSFINVFDRASLPLSCYWRSRFRFYWLNLFGVPAKIKYGVTKTPEGIKGHCWVSTGDEPNSREWEIIFVEESRACSRRFKN
jgi:hypothetical protein